jgi:hypothetical protein
MPSSTFLFQHETSFSLKAWDGRAEATGTGRSDRRNPGHRFHSGRPTCESHRIHTFLDTTGSRAMEERSAESISASQEQSTMPSRTFTPTTTPCARRATSLAGAFKLAATSQYVDHRPLAQECRNCVDGIDHEVRLAPKPLGCPARQCDPRRTRLPPLLAVRRGAALHLLSKLYEHTTRSSLRT